MKNLLSFMLAALVLSGCTTLADARLAKGTGEKRTYASSYDKTWDAAICSLNAKGLSIASENKAENMILAQRGMTAFSYGENVAVFVHKISAQQTEVEVVSKKALKVNITAPNWSDDVLNGVQACIK